MDHTRFDALVRVVGSPASRRAGLRALFGLVAVGSGTTAVDAHRGANRRHENPACRSIECECTTDDECCSGRCIAKSDGTMRCARRTFHHQKKRDVHTPSCRPEEEPCDTSDMCCGSLICVPAGFGEWVCADTCLLAGSTCADARECCQDEQQLACENHRCCAAIDQPCTADNECCGNGIRCINGLCSL